MKKSNFWICTAVLLVLAFAVMGSSCGGSGGSDVNIPTQNNTNNITSNDRTPGNNNNTTSNDQIPGNNGNTTSNDQTPGNNGNTTSNDQTPGNNGNTTSNDQTPGDNGTTSNDQSGGNNGTTTGDTYTSTTAGTHALSLTDGSSAEYENITVTKTGDVSGQNDDYDWKGTNAAVLASGGSKLTITGSSTKITTNAKYGNAVFSYGGNNSNSSNNQGDGTTVTISDATITTSSNNSGGIMTTGGGVMNASNLKITTSGGSSAAIRSDSGGGTVTVNGGTYTTNGTGSPAIYSTAAITVTDADLTANVAQAVVIEGGNSVTLTDCKLTAKHTSLNGQDTTHQAVLIYKSMSKDASSGKSTFKMTDGSITNSNGDIFCVTNTTTEITLSGVSITNNDSSGNFLRAEGQEWGTSGSNGGTVTLNASGQDMAGNVIVDDSSSLTLNMTDSSTFSGAINPSGQEGTVNVVIESGSTWTLTGNSYVTSLTNNGTITKGSYTLYVNGTAQ